MKTQIKNFSREQLLNNECTHIEYYAQFVCEAVISHVKRYIGEKEIKNSADKHFNNIKLSIWDGCANSLGSLSLGIGQKMRDCGDSPTLSGWVCICKEAARQIKEQ